MPGRGGVATGAGRAGTRTIPASGRRRRAGSGPVTRHAVTGRPEPEYVDSCSGIRHTRGAGRPRPAVGQTRLPSRVRGSSTSSADRRPTRSSSTRPSSHGGRVLTSTMRPLGVERRPRRRGGRSMTSAASRRSRLRCRPPRSSSTAAATATFSFSPRPGIGMVTRSSSVAEDPVGQPRASLPTTSATGPVRSTVGGASPSCATAPRRGDRRAPSTASTSCGSRLHDRDTEQRPGRGANGLGLPRPPSRGRTPPRPPPRPRLIASTCPRCPGRARRTQPRRPASAAARLSMVDVDAAGHGQIGWGVTASATRFHHAWREFEAPGTPGERRLPAARRSVSAPGAA